MRKLGRELAAVIVRHLRDVKTTVEYGETSVVFAAGGSGTKVRVMLDGEVIVFGFFGQPLPFDWDQRRSIRRAVAWRHTREQRELIRLGEEMKRAQARKGAL